MKLQSAIRKPHYGAATPHDTKPPPAPKKWMAFSSKDSNSIEAAFHKLADAEDLADERSRTWDDAGGDSSSMPKDASPMKTHRPSRSLAHLNDGDTPSPRVAVNEDYLFDVNIKERELGPAYWLGPVYAVRRGTWFYVEGTNLKPCDENLSFQLEEGYVKLKPWRNSDIRNSGSHSRNASLAETNVPEARSRSISNDRKGADSETASGASPPETKGMSQSTTAFLSHRLFGSYMNSVVTYQDETTAWLLSDDFLSRMSSTVYQRFAGGAHKSGTKVVRGFQDLGKKKVAKEEKRSATPTLAEGEKITDSPRGRSSAPNAQREIVPSLEEETSLAKNGEPSDDADAQPETHVRFLERQMSNLVTSAFQEDPEQQDKEARKREEKEIREDYRDTPGDTQDREIEHLVLVTHGIGQRLGARFETFNFIHDVNELRKTLKAVYAASEDLQALNGELDKISKNCRIQVLPICWRHMLDFPRQSLKHNRKEFDLADAGAEDDESYPSLEDITVDGVPALRNIVADLALDVLLYQTPAYKIHISEIVAKESNRITMLFKQRNPDFRGKVSLIGHSLGSAVFFDLLSDQVREMPAFDRGRQTARLTRASEIKLDFDVENLVCVGSPIGLFQMLNGKRIAGRSNPNQVTLDGSQEGIEDPFSESSYSSSGLDNKLDDCCDAIVSAPKCRQLYNIFHPSDPISYRLEPLISPSMSALKPQALPYTKRSFLGAPMGQGLTGIPARVGQTFSGFWTNFSSGITNNFINRSLGITAEDAAKLGAPAPVPHNRLTELAQAASVGAGTNIVAGGVIPAEQIERHPASSATAGDSRKRKLAHEASEAELIGQHPPTLIDGEIETLYSGFQKQRKGSRGIGEGAGEAEDEQSWKEREERGRKLRREEAKVRALNSNGRVDYSIQE